MTSLETETRIDDSSPAQPVRLRSYPLRRRHPLRALIDEVGLRFNRVLDRIPGMRRFHDSALRSLRIPELDWHLPAAGSGLDGLRIAFLTDLHLGSFFAGDQVEGVFARVAAAEPDLICFGGDLINTRGRELELLGEPIRRLTPKYGMFAVPGNHDHRWHHDMGEWHDYLESLGVHVLNNHGVRIEAGGGSLWLAGVDDKSDGRPDLPRALRGRRPGEPCLLLAHHPDHFVEAADHDVDLTLSGHTHGGQMRAFGWAPIKHSRHGYLAGGFDCERGRCRLHVSHGVGVTLLPFRVGAPPEVPIFRVVAD